MVLILGGIIQGGTLGLSYTDFEPEGDPPPPLKLSPLAAAREGPELMCHSRAPGTSTTMLDHALGWRLPWGGYEHVGAQIRQKGGGGGGDEREVKDGMIHSDPWVRWTDLEILHNFPSGLNKKGARGKAEMSIFAFFCAQRRQHRPPLRGGRLR